MKKLLSLFLVALMLFSSSAALAHSGRTDSHGGHRDTKNKSGLGYYHYHCGGHKAHLHKNGVCPYKKSSSSSSSSSSSLSTWTIKKIQTRLNKLGYNAGKADGVWDSTVKSALKAFQKKNGLTANGSYTSATKSKLFSSSAKKK